MQNESSEENSNYRENELSPFSTTVINKVIQAVMQQRAVFMTSKWGDWLSLVGHLRPLCFPHLWSALTKTFFSPKKPKFETKILNQFH